MEVRLPLWVLRRLIRLHPWLLSDSGTVSRSFVIDLMFGEITIKARLALSEEQRITLAKEQRAVRRP